MIQMHVSRGECNDTHTQEYTYGYHTKRGGDMTVKKGYHPPGSNDRS